MSEGEVGAESLRCPVLTCGAPLSVGDVHAFTWGRGRTDLWERFEKMSDERELEALVTCGHARRCPAPTCNYIFIWSATEDPRAFACPCCESSFCLACDAAGGQVGPAHPGMSCSEFVAKVRADAEAAERLERWKRDNE